VLKPSARSYTAATTDYGLAGGVWSGDRDRAVRVARRLRTGQVEINGAAFNPLPRSAATSSPATAASWAPSESWSSPL
jgi:acyl-CoA reductase-like NAD-dependent aldehyde dehydrogenase